MSEEEEAAYKKRAQKIIWAGGSLKARVKTMSDNKKGNAAEPLPELVKTPPPNKDREVTILMAGFGVGLTFGILGACVYNLLISR